MSLIVIVDDRSINRTIYAKLAQSIGAEVEARAFADPTEALNWLATNRADLVVTDHDMPQIDGDEFISRFRALPGAASVPVMMITVNDQRQLRLRALESGANDFLPSPIDHCEFVMRARNLLKLAQAAEPKTLDSPAASEPAPLTEAPQRRSLRLQPRLDLATGRIAGAQVLRGDSPAELADPEALRAALACAKALRARRREPIRFALSVHFDEDRGAAAALHLVGRLAEAGLAPQWLDLRFAASDIIAAPRRADLEAMGFEALGARLTLDLSEDEDLNDAGKEIPAALQSFVESWRPNLLFSCAGEEALALRRAERLARWRNERPLRLLADAVDSVALLRPLRRLGVAEAQGGCFGAPFAPGELPGLIPALAAEPARRRA